MITLNLLPDIKLEYLKTRRTQARVVSTAILVTAAVIGLVVLVAIWVYGVQAVQKSYLTGEIEKNGKELKQLPEIDKYLTLQNQLGKLTALHEGKNDFSRLLTYLPALNPAPPNNVTFTSVEAGTTELGNALSFRGETSNYTALNTFRDTLINATLKHEGTSEKLFDSVVVSSSSLELGATGGVLVVFSIDTTYNPNAFLSSVKDPVVSVPQITTTPSTQAAPNAFRQSSVKEQQ